MMSQEKKRKQSCNVGTRSRCQSKKDEIFEKSKNRLFKIKVKKQNKRQQRIKLMKKSDIKNLYLELKKFKAAKIRNRKNLLNLLLQDWSKK